MSLKIIELLIGFNACRITVVYPVLVGQSFLLGYSKILGIRNIGCQLSVLVLISVFRQNIE